MVWYESMVLEIALILCWVHGGKRERKAREKKKRKGISEKERDAREETEGEKRMRKRTLKDKGG